jgi:hypothetical protein
VDLNSSLQAIDIFKRPAYRFRNRIKMRRSFSNFI